MAKSKSLIAKYSKKRAKKKRASSASRPNLSADIKSSGIFSAMSSLFRKSPAGLISKGLEKSAGKTKQLAKMIKSKQDGISNTALSSKQSAPKNRKLSNQSSTIEESMSKANVKMWR